MKEARPRAKNAKISVSLAHVITKSIFIGSDGDHREAVRDVAITPGRGHNAVGESS